MGGPALIGSSPEGVPSLSLDLASAELAIVRIIAGRWAGRPLASPSGRVRPTGEAVRVEALRLVREPLPDARVLDLFAGSGALGLEALSRGAAAADFVESHPSALHALKANVAAVVFMEQLETDAHDLAFADPPYASGLASRVARRWLEVPFARVLVIKHALDRTLPGGGEEHAIGESVLSVFRAQAGLT